MTAYFGSELGAPKAGETVFISGAAGAVGSIVGQLFKVGAELPAPVLFGV
jgi:NADPH-dependent curcumin reductase CurA